ncbi:splicing factor YJU2-like [Dysidea avara]|uniref:splicing factor YJU2-like n=1 Tax=Dysidea avara TaxID=196820 RepID=UPI003320DCBA
MGERKVLNKYYPPDFFDSLKHLPKLKVPKDQHHVIRIMSPFTMRCVTCGEYIYKGRKFNARMEVAKGEEFLGLRIYRFYIRCPKCLTDITYKTDPENEDYAPEHGAVRTFQAERLAELEAERLKREREEEEANNPMKALEHRTKESRHEMDVLDALEELKDLNARNAHVDYQQLLSRHLEYEKVEEERQEAEDEALIKEIFQGKTDGNSVKRLVESDSDEDSDPCKKGEGLQVQLTSQEASRTGAVKTGSKRPQPDNRNATDATDMLLQQQPQKSRSTNKLDISCLVKRKKPSNTVSKAPSTTPAPNTHTPAQSQTSSDKPALTLVSAYSDSSDDDNNS